MEHGTVVGLPSPASHVLKKLLAGRAVGDRQYAAMLRPRHNAGQRHNHALAKLTFRFTAKGNRIITPRLSGHLAV